MARRWMDPGQYKEVVQIGAVKVDSSYAPLDTFNVLVRPRLNPVISPYLEKLTGITNEALSARGMDFLEAYEAFVRFSAGLPILAFGRDDAVLIDNIRLYGMRDISPMPPFLNLHAWLGQYGIDYRRMHACDVGPAAGVPFEGQTHDGLCDALGVAAGVRALIARGAKPPVLPGEST